HPAVACSVPSSCHSAVLQHSPGRSRQALRRQSSFRARPIPWLTSLSQLPCERDEQWLDERDRFPSRFFGVRQRLTVRILLREASRHCGDVTQDGGQELVELLRGSPRQPVHALHF